MQDIITQVRREDHDRFLCIQLAPAAKRAALYALTVLQIELAHVAEVAREPLVAHMRYAWWREGVEEAASGALTRPHPVLQALVPVLVEHPSLLAHLLRMVEARAADVDATLLDEAGGWEAYLDGTAGALHAAWALVLDADAAQAHAETIAAQARDYAMMGLVRALPFHTARGMRRFPIARLRVDAGEAAMTQDVMQLLQTFPCAKQPLPRTLTPLNGLHALARMHAKSLANAQGNPGAVAPAPLAAAWRILWLKISKI